MGKDIKEGIKVLGIACSSFNRIEDKTVAIIGVVLRGVDLLEGVLKTTVTVDGLDATDKIIEMIEKSPHKKQLKCVVTRGITIAGFNFINMQKIFQETNLPIISIVDRQPNITDIEQALENLPQRRQRLEILVNSGSPRKVTTSPEEEPVFVHSVGLDEQTIKQLLKKITRVGRIPEPVRVARLIAIAEV